MGAAIPRVSPGVDQSGDREDEVENGRRHDLETSGAVAGQRKETGVVLAVEGEEVIQKARKELPRKRKIRREKGRGKRNGKNSENASEREKRNVKKSAKKGSARGNSRGKRRESGERAREGARAAKRARSGKSTRARKR